jgi:hypothetical protein
MVSHLAIQSKRMRMDSLPMMPLKTKPLGPSHPGRNPNLSDIVRLGRARVALDQILDLARKHLPVRVAGQTRRRLRREN